MLETVCLLVVRARVYVPKVCEDDILEIILGEFHQIYNFAGHGER